jgi:imidazolonepropionase-like amidohydrolase
MGNVARRSGRRYVNGVPIVCIPLTVRPFREKGKRASSEGVQHAHEAGPLRHPVHRGCLTAIGLVGGTMASLILHNARLIDGIGRVWERATIQVEGDSIRAVSEDGPPDNGAERIDLSGRTVIPGLMNCHTHVCGAIIPPPPGATPAQQLAVYAVRGERWLRQALDMGVTAIRDVGGLEHVDLGLKRMLESGMVAGPRMRAVGKLITMTGGHGYPQGMEADGPDEVRKAVRTQIKAGADAVKLLATGGIATPGTWPGAPQLTLAELTAGVEEAHNAGWKVGAHAEGKQGIKNAVLAGVDSIEHGYEVDAEIIELMLERGTFLCPTLTCDIRIAEHGDDYDLPPGSVEKMKHWIEPLVTSFERAHKAGVRIAAGNDSFADWVPISDMAGELAAMVQYGMDPHAAILAATANSAELLQLPDEGTLAPGKRATLVVLDGDPIANIANLGKVVGVMKDGRWVRTPVPAT